MESSAGEFAMSPSEARVRAALSFRQPDRLPRYDSFWPEFTEEWRRKKGLPDTASPEDHYGIDLTVAVADESPWPSGTAVIAEDGNGLTSRDGWGRVARTKKSAQFSEVLEVALPEKGRLSELAFESPLSPGRYRSFLRALSAEHPKRAVFAKTGGPFLRTANLRGEVEWLMDLAADPEFAGELAGLVTDHMTAVGVESLRLGGQRLSGIWIYDDVGSNAGPMVSPRTYERVFQPLMARMVSAYRKAGADFVVFHSDGNIEPLVEMLIEAGVDAIQPIEPKAGMDIVALRRRFGDRLALIGGLDNAFVLPSGDRQRVREHLDYVLGIAGEGGLILGTHSIGPDVAVETYDYLIGLEEAWGG